MNSDTVLYVVQYSFLDVVDVAWKHGTNTHAI
jgi:hypothetical protein